MAKKQIQTILEKAIRNKSHRITVHSSDDALISFDNQNKVRSLQIKGVPHNHNTFNQIKLEVDKTLYLFNKKKV